MKTKNEKTPNTDISVKVNEKQNKPTVTTKTEVKEPKKEIPVHPLDALIENIKTDRVLLEEQEIKLKECKDAKTDITSRLRDYRSDLRVFLKYATDKQKAEIELLGLDTTVSTKQTINPIVEIALKIMQEKKKLTNEELFEEYVNVIPKGQTPENYTFFNIKIRSLFNRQVLTKEKGKDSKSSKSDIITLNETKTE
jgi:hypothetical protein